MWTIKGAWAQTGTVKALLIGNDTYSQSDVFPQLRGTPQRDVDAVAGALRSSGVAKKDITILNNLGYSRFFEALHTFRLELKDGDSAIFYYSGHGFSINENAFLVPTDLKLGSTKRATESRSVSLDQVKRDLSKAQMRALIIDACRTNIPLPKQALKPEPPPSLANLYDSKPAGTGELIVFATQGGKPAIAEAPAEGLSYFTYYFVKRLESTPLDLGTVVLQAQIATSTSSLHSQEPEVRNNLQGYLFFPGSKIESIASSVVLSAQPPLPPAEPDYKATLPLICPTKTQFSPSWRMSELGPGSGFYGERQIVFQAMLGSSSSLLNPILLNHLSSPEMRLAGDMVSSYQSLTTEIQSTMDPVKELKGPHGPIKLQRRLSSITREVRSQPTLLYVGFVDSLGSDSIFEGGMKFPITTLSGEMQSFVARLDQLSAQKMSEACEAALERFSTPTP